MKTDTSKAIKNDTGERVFVVRLTHDDGTNWYLVAWSDDNHPTLYNEIDFKNKFTIS